MIVNWHELTPRCYGILDIPQFNFLRTASGLSYLGYDPIPEYINLAKRKEYALARKLARIMAAGVKD